MYEYNTNKSDLILREYGRNIQKLVNYLISIEDRDKRTESAHTLIELMKQINPRMKEGSEYNQKLWDDLYIMSNFRLDVDSPFPMPEKELLGKKPQHVRYNQNRIRYKHYGRNIELLIEKARGLSDEQEIEASVGSIGKLMKTFYSAWNREVVDDEVILENIQEISGGKIKKDIKEIRDKNLFDTYRDKSRSQKTRKTTPSTGRQTTTGKRRRS
ncbi:DUF4290 domain-containing protein [Xanthovirga aplysinae]|uniref:DUF4290 domain-containing protein n=1 Tax=Xanthovirga aplysinae TaxID=2529853 RepID=UPI0012BC4B95|nr:DUF4290 domain-containing protein [Xanthovirga aplysinae]MTI33608.1 DUF4290 domain-containing protein [Xanthovirga aplysinae]